MPRKSKKKPTTPASAGENRPQTSKPKTSQLRRRCREQRRSTGMDTNLLSESDQQREDTKLVETAVRGRWPIPAGKRASIVNRLVDIVEQDPITVDEESGATFRDGKVDAMAVQAAKVLVTMEGQNQGDDHQALGKKVHYDLTGIVGVAAIDPRREMLASVSAKLGVDYNIVEAASRAVGAPTVGTGIVPAIDSAAS